MAIEPAGHPCLRPRIPGAPDPELLWGWVMAFSAVFAAFWLKLGFPTPLCPFHALTGMPCPACGTTRAARALLRGDLPDALAWNPLGSLALMGAVFFAGYAAIVVALRLPRIRWEGAPPRLWRLGIALILGLNWGWLLLLGRI